MSLMKQFFIIITVVFISVFVSNFVISIQNTKEYIEEELTTKAKDTATSLGMLLKKHISTKDYSELDLIIKSVADSGFYNEIRLEDAYFSFNKVDLLVGDNSNIRLEDITKTWIDNNQGELIENNENIMEQQLNMIENIEENISIENKNTLFTYIPNNNDNKELNVYFQYMINGEVREGKQTIKLNNILVQNIRSIQFDTVPLWFVSMIDFQIEEQKSEINNNWKLTAIVYVKPNPGIAYEKLYQQFITTLMSAILLFTIFITFILVFVKILLNPLKEIEQVAKKISQCEFDKVKSISWTSEFNGVANAINSMSKKLENIIVTLNNDIKLANQQLNEDRLTGLELKEAFVSEIKEIIYNKKTGYIILFKILNLTEFSKNNARIKVNEFIVGFADILKEIKGAKGFRFIGSEFVLLLENYSKRDIVILEDELEYKFSALAKKFNKQDIFNAGVTKFNKLSRVAGILSALDESCRMSKMIGINNFYFIEDASNSKGYLEWNTYINDVIKNNKFNLEILDNTYTIFDNHIIMSESQSNIFENDNKLPIGSFISIAEENGMIVQFDKIVIKKVLESISQNNFERKIIVNISIHSLINADFLIWLEETFKSYKLKNKLVFSISAYAISNYFQEFRNSIRRLNSMGIEIMIKRFESKYIDSEQLKFLKPNFIRLAQTYTNKLEENDNQLVLLNLICKVTNILDIQVLVEGEINEKYSKKLSNIGIFAISNF